MCIMFTLDLKRYGSLDLMSAYFYGDHMSNVHIALWNETCGSIGINYQICTHTHMQLDVHTTLHFSPCVQIL